MNQLHAVALNEGLRYKKRLWREVGGSNWSLSLSPWASRRRRDLLELLDRLNPTIAELSQAMSRKWRNVRGPAVGDASGGGPLTAMAFVLIIGRAERFQCGKQIGCYLGLVPLEDSSGERDGWDISRNKATLCCVSCWWKRRKLRCAAIRMAQ